MNAKLCDELVGKEFTCMIRGDFCEGKLQKNVGSYFLCQNIKDGVTCKDKLGYRFAWNLGTAAEFENNNQGVTCLLFISKDPSTYKDWQVGDKIVFEKSSPLAKSEILLRNGCVVVFGNENTCSSTYTCNQLFNSGWRLDIPKQEEPKIIELTIDQIAEKYGVAASQIKIKK